MNEILLADDEPNQIELMKFNLEKNGFLVKSAYNGEQALDMIYEKKPTVLIADWMMPKMSGIELCRILRSNKDTKLLPIIMLSARSEEADKSLGLDTGADDYISKPFSPMELVSRVKALIRRTNTSMSIDELIVGELKISLSEMQVFRNDQLIKLGPKEFKLLTLLAERPGHIFSRQKLLDTVWGVGIFIEDRTVDVHMSRLRKALRINETDTDLIRTVRDGGYGLLKP
ncbi:MAG: DNA-binding response regulator [Alphaproteobacteria bacterium]|jgi:two-component system phosphate regulon response regulator PhoB|nr:MAG: DNA-binding response regulator [Alphaproteobacteria bacterium]|tara:strand:+ start:249 stop:935 length:687 start_codon:yes stop_codon:yes gene_type:complete